MIIKPFFSIGIMSLFELKLDSEVNLFEEKNQFE